MDGGKGTEKIGKRKSEEVKNKWQIWNEWQNCLERGESDMIVGESNENKKK